jgi:hypothetical protein
LAWDIAGWWAIRARAIRGPERFRGIGVGFSVFINAWHFWGFLKINQIGSCASVGFVLARREIYDALFLGESAKKSGLVKCLGNSLRDMMLWYLLLNVSTSISARNTSQKRFI